MEPSELLEEIYSKSMKIVGSDNQIKTDLDDPIKEHLTIILDKSESAKAVITVIITSVMLIIN